jgi:hypothetical protein
MKKRLKAIFGARCFAIANWAWEYLITRHDEPTIACRIGRRLERRFTLLWFWAYQGSDEEVQDGLDNIAMEVPEEYLTKNQREIKRRLCAWVDATEIK